MKNKVTVKIVNEGQNELPVYSKAGDACVDLRADFSKEWDDTMATGAAWDPVAKCLRIFSGGRALVSSGIRVQCPPGYMFRLMERSGLSTKGLKLSAGVVDSGYNGLIYISLINLSDDDFEIRQGDRIAQAAIIPVPQIEWQVVDKLDKSERGDKGFNSTGVQ